MPDVNPEELFQLGRAHGLSANLLFAASKRDAQARGLNDPDHFAFNGIYSPSVHYLLGLAAELMLKAAYVASGGSGDPAHLRAEIGHDLIKALNAAEGRGFNVGVENFRAILEVMREPYLRHFFRYDHPSQFPLPDVPCVIAAYEVLDEQLRQMFDWPET